MTNVLPGTPGRAVRAHILRHDALTSDKMAVFHVLRHGTTTHGRQDRRGAVMRKLPLSYYHPKGPIGQLVEKQRSWKRPLRVAVVGLGTGTMAAYAEANDVFVFYEIDS